MLLLLKPWLRQCVWHRVEHMQRRWSNFYIRASPSHASDTCIHQPHQEGPFLFGDHAVRGGAAWLVPAAEHWCTAPLPVSSHGNLRGAIRCNLAANCCPSSSAHRDAAGCRCLHPFINNGVKCSLDCYWHVWSDRNQGIKIGMSITLYMHVSTWYLNIFLNLGNLAS